jgi:hypothetical protein
MNPFLEGALVGAGVGLFLYVAEYMILRGHVNERAARYKKPAALDQTERRRLRAVGSFALLLPFAFAIGFWMLSKG